MTLVLDTTTKKIKAKLGAAGTATMFFGVYSDFATAAPHVPGTNDVTSNGTSYVDVIAAPAASTYRQCKNLYCYNGDTVAQTVTLALDNNSTVRVICVVTLQAGESKDLLAIAAATGAQLGVPNTWTAAQTFSAGLAGIGFGGLTNKLLNPQFELADYATSQTAVGYGSVNRWGQDWSGSTCTMSQQASTFGDNPGNPKKYLRRVVTSSSGAENYALWYQKLESVLTSAGKRVSFPLRAKGSANGLKVAFEIVQYFGSGGSPSPTVRTYSGQITLTTSWADYVVYLDVPSVTGKILGTSGTDSCAIYIWEDAGSTYNSNTGSLGQQSGTFEYADMQWEEAYAASPFNARPLALEKILCARYLPVWESLTASVASLCTAQCYSTTALVAELKLFVPTRIAPTGITISSVSHFSCYSSNATAIALTGLAFSTACPYSIVLSLTVASGLTGGNAALVYSSNASAKLIATGCEL
jgi:hypothetical protein